ncbi:DUF5107 domain-containing protein [Marinimicrobium agarilyticum]|uniref:DUF5107 domain-containing protein n=1 Tax=Marinimicrobium agarilyticum TaxID=306546 RepID=UPI00040F0907|nr:DUF5107 domain-containing protein [Marinimicrobium agarilyticum]
MYDDKMTVKAWQEAVTIPTYPVGEEERNPMFFEKRVYQGSSGKVYPHPITEKILDQKEDRTYNGVFLENCYLKVMILPELGGRVQMAYDKVKQRHFIYHNQVIKPALVGLLGPWISGGIEFNWPQHHRPTTFKPVDFAVQENSDGSKTVWTHEFEIMSHTRGAAGFTLYPGKAYLEVEAKIFNSTYLPQTFLWWANPAVAVNDHYQSVFPPDVNAVFDHGKRDVSTFPIATGTYYKIDYSPGTDISRFRNIPVPTSYMAMESDFDFIGGYEHDSESGLLHVADHHVSPGKKQWTWGNGEFGKAWDRNLTDEDGPYVELMTGVYTDNQPDFAWLMPFEEKSFSQVFMPYQKVGMVKNATRDIVIGIEPEGPHAALITIYASSEQNNRVELYINERRVFEESFSVSPEKLYQKSISCSETLGEANYVLVVLDHSGKELVRYEPASIQKNEIPEAADAAEEPSQVTSIEKLYLTGLHLEQYRHATYSPVDYYEEALRREPGDVRNNSALGLWHLRRGRFAESEDFFERAIETLTYRNPNPYVGEPYFHLGVAMKFQGKLSGAYNAFYKAAWNRAWQDASYFCLAQIDTYRGSYDRGLEHINKSLDLNRNNAAAWALKAALLRKLGRLLDATQVSEAAIALDGFNLTARFEHYLAESDRGERGAASSSLELLEERFRNDVETFINGASEYAHAGMFDEAISLLALVRPGQDGRLHPMVYYHTGWFCQMKGDTDVARKYYRMGAQASPDYCFPNRLEAIPALQEAMKADEHDARAPYYLGCLFYDKQQYDLATGLWEEAARKDARFPTVHRNLAIATFNHEGDAQKALELFEKAFSLGRSDARVFMELDQLYKRMNHRPEKRLAFLESHLDLVDQRDDVYLERIGLHNVLGNHEEAYTLITERTFHPWEGGEGRVSGQYVYSLMEMAKENLAAGEYEQAIEKLRQACVYPENLGEGKLYTARENDINYWLGVAHDLSGNKAKAKDYWEKATQGDDEPAAAVFYNDTPPEHILYQGLAWRNLNEPAKADAIFRKLVHHGEVHKDDHVAIDYFAVSLPNMLIFDDDLNLRNRVHCLYVTGLGLLGRGQTREAKLALEEAVRLDEAHFGAISHLRLANRPSLMETRQATNVDCSA